MTSRIFFIQIIYMSKLLQAIGVAVMLLTIQPLVAQSIKGKVIDSVSKEPVQGATVCCGKSVCLSNSQGEFIFNNSTEKIVSVSYAGYQSVKTSIYGDNMVVELSPSNSPLQEVVVSANRDAVKRSEAPVAISTISSKQLQDTKPVTLDQVLNKVSGVYMVNLGNEQHSMSIRQPMTTKSLFLYLEDGIPVRTTGLFNHNALLEMNMTAVKSIEVIKGPSSSLYGSEAIGGVVNFITAAPPAIPNLKVSVQGNNIGYKRAELQTGFTKGKWGVVFSGYYADKRNSFIEYTDFHKAVITARVDYRFSDKTSLSNSFTLLRYYSDMTGGIDSAHFASHSFESAHTFTYRKVNALRYRSTLTHNWSSKAKTMASFVFRDNMIGQNPAYAVKDDYRRLPNGVWTGKKDLAHGEINEAGFNSYALIIQHRQNLNWKKAVIIGGLAADISPSDYTASYIRITKDSITKKYTGYQSPDSVLTHYKNGIDNYAAFLNFECSPIEKLRMVASLRYDFFQYDFNNYLAPSAYSGSPDTSNSFSAISPKLGFTYNFSSRIGLYANYSQGFVPPQVTEMYKGVKVPELKPSVFYNYEIGGWISLLKGKLTADMSAYLLKGTNEVISVRMDDGSSQNMNAGATSHKGIEIGMAATPVKDISVRFSGAYSKHGFTTFVEKGVSYSGKEMNAAPRWMHNAEIWYRPSFIHGFRLGVEWQQVGNYYMDPLNTVKYKGYNVLHARAGYRHNNMEIWVNVMNIGNAYYAYTSSKSSSGYSYTPAEPRHFNLGISYNLINNKKKSDR
jgi:outer membrane receptor protein involved in Fe transport